MKKRALTLVLILALTLLACIASAEAAYPEGLRFDGIYSHLLFDDNGKINNNVLEFYEDGTVIGATLGESSDQGSFPLPKTSWFNRESTSPLSVGTYTYDGHILHFATTSPAGTVEYLGVMDGDALILSSYSHINGYHAFDRRYIFYSLDELPE